jgi:hypothetical protein
MAQTGFTPISLYYTTTAAAVPTASNLVAGELAINTQDGKLFYKDAAGVVQTIASKNGVAGGSNTQVQYNSSGSLAGDADMTFNGTTLTLANDASISGLTVGKGAGAVATNTALGASALAVNSTGAAVTAIGSSALAANTADGGTAIGRNSLAANTTGTDNTGIGRNALLLNTTGANNVALGKDSLSANTTASNNTAVGYQAGYANTTGTNLTAVGKGAGYSNTTGDNVTVVGVNALYSNTTGAGNSAFGQGSLNANTTGSYNTAHGAQTLLSNTTSSNNTAVGYQALYSNVVGTNGGSGAFGYQALYSATEGNNWAFGNYALTDATTGTSNCAFGGSAGSSATSASWNVLIGTNAAYQITTGSGNISINSRNGSGTYAPCLNITTENNRISMGSTGVTNAYVQVSWTVLSDARDKTNITNAPYGLDFVNELRPVTYQWDKRSNYEDGTPDGTHLEPKLQLGFLAQDVIDLELKYGATAKDLLVGDDEFEDSLKVTEAKLIPVLVKAIQELKAEVDSLKQQLGK